MDIVKCWEDNTVGSDKVAKLAGLECAFAAVLQVVIRVAGIVAFIFLIIGGFNWLTSGGDPKKLQTARNTITWAIAGIVLLILAWIILRFISIFTGVDVTIFKIRVKP